MAQKHEGMANVAYEAYVNASHAANIDIDSRTDKRIVQTVGNAAASAGFHHADGTLDGAPYTAALDLSVKGLTNTQRATWIEELCRHGFVAFFRNWPGNLHIHANYAGVPQKRQLDKQNEDFFAGKDGLVGHHKIDDEWWFPSIELRRIPEKMFRIANGPNPRVVSAPAIRDAAEANENSLALYFGKDIKPRLWMPVIDGVSLVPVRAFGSALGFDTVYDPKRNQVTYDGHELPIAIKNIAGVGHVPLRDVAREVGLNVEFDHNARKVTVKH